MLMSTANSALRTPAPATDARDHVAAARGCVALAEVPRAAWEALCGNAVVANPFYDPDWCLAAAAGARVQAGARALTAWRGDRLIGLLPVVSAWQAMRLPLPLLCAWQAYGPLTVPLIDRAFAPDAWRGLRAAAAGLGVRGIRFAYFDADGAVASLIDPSGEALARRIGGFTRAQLDATQDGEAAVRDGFGRRSSRNCGASATGWKSRAR